MDERQQPSPREPYIRDLLDTLARCVADGDLDGQPFLRRSTIDGLRAAGLDLTRYHWETDPDEDTDPDE